MLVTELGILREVKELQFWKVPSPMLVTELGILMEVKELQLRYLLLVDYQYYTL